MATRVEVEAVRRRPGGRVRDGVLSVAVADGEGVESVAGLLGDQQRRPVGREGDLRRVGDAACGVRGERTGGVRQGGQAARMGCTGSR